MIYNFDTIVDRKKSTSIKWGKYPDTDVIPMWVADMDFQSPPEILEALHKHINHGIFGYSKPPDELIAIITNRIKIMYEWHIDESWIVWLPGVVAGLNMACRTLDSDSDEVLTFIPIYPPFLTAPRFSNKKVIMAPLARQNNMFTFDFHVLKKTITTNCKMLLLCNPHNPTGRSYNVNELKELASFCLENKLTVCSDEIHCDLILNGNKHIPIASIDKNIEMNSITLMSPTKTFNLSGLNCSFAIIPNPAIRKKFVQLSYGIVPPVSPLAYTACVAAYKNCAEWHKELLSYLRKNRDLLLRHINEEIPFLSMDQTEATYLAWIDTKNLPVSGSASFFEKAGVGLYPGRYFRDNNYVRLNFACQHEILVTALHRIKDAVKSDLTRSN